MRKLKITTPSGLIFRFTSDTPLTGEQVNANITLAMRIDKEIGGSDITPQELKRRIASKGYHPKTGKSIH